MENKLVRDIITILSKKQNCKVDCRKVLDRWLLTSQSDKLDFEFTVKGSAVTVKMAKFPRKRKGTMTDIVKCIQDYGKSIIVKSVSSTDMYYFCDKNNFRLQSRGIGFGDYIKSN